MNLSILLVFATLLAVVAGNKIHIFPYHFLSMDIWAFILKGRRVAT